VNCRIAAAGWLGLELLRKARNTLDELAERLAFVRPPFDLANVAAK